MQRHTDRPEFQSCESQILGLQMLVLRTIYRS